MDTSASAGASGDTATSLLNKMTASVPEKPSSSSDCADLLILEPLAGFTWTFSMLAQSAGTAAQYFASTAPDMASFSDSDSAANAISTKL